MDSNYFYDAMRAFYDGGVDYLTREKHRLAVITEDAWIKLLHLSDDERLDEYPFSREEIQQDQEKIVTLQRFFEDANEIRQENGEYIYELEYDHEIQKLDEILLKYIEFFESDFYKAIKAERYAAFEAWLETDEGKAYQAEIDAQDPLDAFF